MFKFITLAFSIFFSITFIAAQQTTTAGENAPNVKMVDCDDFNSFHEGYCVVKKGNKTGLIDSLGNMVIKYTDKYIPENANFKGGFQDGMLPVVDIATNLQGYMNKQLKLVIPCVYEKAGPFTNGYASVRSTNPRDLYGYVSKTGTKIARVDNTWGEEPLIPVHADNQKGSPSGFNDPFGKRVFNFKFDEARTFSGGLAAVMRLDEVGKPKWGFIDTKGKMVIDFKYSIEPGDFREGRAIVVPAVSDEVAYAFIDRTGTVKLSVSIKDGGDAISNGRHALGVVQYPIPAQPLDRYDFKKLNNRNFLGGLASLYSENVHYIFMDTLGNKHRYPNISNARYRPMGPGVIEPNDTREVVYGMLPPFIDHSAVFIVNSSGFGLMNDRNEVLIDAIFSELEAPLPGQQLLKAFISRGNKESKENPNKRGFVNLKGEFVILKAAAATW